MIERCFSQSRKLGMHSGCRSGASKMAVLKTWNSGPRGVGKHGKLKTSKALFRVFAYHLKAPHALHAPHAPHSTSNAPVIAGVTHERPFFPLFAQHSTNGHLTQRLHGVISGFSTTTCAYIRCSICQPRHVATRYLKRMCRHSLLPS